MPYNFDPDAPDPSLEAGIHLWRVTKCEEGKSKSKGLNQFKVNLVRVDNSSAEFQVYIPLEGASRKYGIPKILAFLPGKKGPIDAVDFLDRRVWIATRIKQDKDKDGNLKPGEFRLDINENLLRYKGMQPENEVPDGYSAPKQSGWDVGNDPWPEPQQPKAATQPFTPIDVDDTPF